MSSISCSRSWDIIHVPNTVAAADEPTLSSRPTPGFYFEFKLDKSPREAIEQINRKGYALPFSSEGKEIIKIGVNFSSTLRNIDSWIVEKDD